MNWAIETLAIPVSLDGPEGDDFREMVTVRNRVEAEVVGTFELAPTADDLLPRWQDPYRLGTLFVARLDGAIVARATLTMGVDEDATEAWTTIEVLPEVRRRGIGSALYEAARDAAIAAGRTVLQGETLSADATGERLSSPSGFGSVPRDSPAARFALARGFSLELVNRASRLPLPLDASALLAQAELASGDDYRVVTWEGSTPEDRLDDLARLHSRMSTDAPYGDLEITEEVWDTDRVRALDDLRSRTGTTTLTAAAEHVASRQLVAFSELSVPVSLELAVHQQDTLVLKEHRGRRLGMLTKVANLALLGRLRPGHPSVITFNAEENRHMLSVNEALGFVAFGYEGDWKKQL